VRVQALLHIDGKCPGHSMLIKPGNVTFKGFVESSGAFDLLTTYNFAMLTFISGATTEESRTRFFSISTHQVGSNRRPSYTCLNSPLTVIKYGILSMYDMSV